MPVVRNKIDNILEKKDLTHYKLSKLIDYSESSLNHMINGKRPFQNDVIEKLLPILEITKDEFISWIVADKYPKESIQTAVAELKKESDSDTLVITRNIDKILTEKKLSRTQLSKFINYSQSGLNRMITDKISMSDTVISRIARFFDIPESTIRGWILADKYSLRILELSLMA